FFRGAPRADGERKDITWLQPSGDEMTDSAWQDPELRTLGALLAGDQLRSPDPLGNRRVDSSFVLYLHAGSEPVDVVLPVDGAQHYVTVFRTDARPSAVPVQPGEKVRLADHAFALLEVYPRPS